jgi:hypothetical protein
MPEAVHILIRVPNRVQQQMDERQVRRDHEGVRAAHNAGKDEAYAVL